MVTFLDQAALLFDRRDPPLVGDAVGIAWLWLGDCSVAAGRRTRSSGFDGLPTTSWPPPRCAVEPVGVAVASMAKAAWRDPGDLAMGDPAASVPTEARSV